MRTPEIAVERASLCLVPAARSSQSDADGDTNVETATASTEDTTADEIISSDFIKVAQFDEIMTQDDATNFRVQSNAAITGFQVVSVRFGLANRDVFSADVPNPNGDRDFVPPGRSELEQKGARLVQLDLLRNLLTFAEELPTVSSINDLASLLQGGQS